MKTASQTNDFARLNDEGNGMEWLGFCWINNESICQLTRPFEKMIYVNGS